MCYAALRPTRAMAPKKLRIQRWLGLYRPQPNPLRNARVCARTDPLPGKVVQSPFWILIYIMIYVNTQFVI